MTRLLARRILIGSITCVLIVGVLVGTLVPGGATRAAKNSPLTTLLSSLTSLWHPNTGQVTVTALSHPLTAPPITTSGNGLGAPGFYTLVNGRCGCFHKGVRVNVANGNLVVQATDLHITGTGLDLSLASTYNSLAGATLNLGQNWVLGTGGDVSLHVNGDGSVNYNGPDGYAALFALSSGVFTDAPGLDATLVKHGDGTYTLTFHKKGEYFTFAANGNLSADTDKNGNHVTFAYNGANQITSLTDTQGRNTTFAYNTSGYITTITDSTNRTVVYGYDTSNRLTSSTDLNGKKTTFGYTGSDLTSITDPLSNLTSIVYDTSHRVTKITDAVSTVTKFTYNTGNTVVTDGNNHNTTYTYDSQLRVTSTKDALNHTHSATWNSDNNIAQTTDALSDQTTNAWSTDGNNNLLSTTDGSGAINSNTYTNVSHPYYAANGTDTQGNVVAYTYDTPGNLSQSQDGLTSGNTVSATYNTNGTTATTTDGNGHVTTYGYDTHGNLTSVTYPTGSTLGSYALTYDGLSRLATVTDGKNQKTTYTYDKLDRVTKITYADSTTVVYTYDDDGNIKTLVDGTGTTTFAYDGVNEQLSKLLPDSTAFTYTYDAVGSLSSYGYGPCLGCSTYHTIGFTFNAVNLEATATEDGAALATFGYDNANRQTSIAYPNGVTQTITYDGAGHETNITAKHGSTVLTNFTYSYLKPSTTTATGLRYSVTDKNNNTTKYTYDALNRLTDASIYNSGGTKTAEYQYALDSAGNRTSATIPSGTTTYSYNSGNELTSSVKSGATTTYSYDGDGNQTGKSGVLSAGYNALNQTTSFTPSGGSALSYSYTGPNQAEWSSVAGTGITYSKVGLYGNGTDVYYQDARGNLLAGWIGAGEYYYLEDGLGSIVGLTDVSGNVVQSYQYDPYGNITSSTGSITTNPWRFAGGFYDSNTGLYKFGVRYYDPTLGRWTQQDPLGGSLFDPSTGNRYTYTSDIPTSLTDPSGDFTVSLCANGIVGAGVGVLGSACVSGGYSGSAGFSGGFSESAGGAGVAGWVASAGGSIGFSNANRVSDLSGPFVISGFTGGPLVNGGVEGFVGKGVGGFSVGAGFGPPSLAFYGGATDTWVQGG